VCKIKDEKQVFPEKFFALFNHTFPVAPNMMILLLEMAKSGRILTFPSFLQET
jgi:hypothetical protein